MMAKKKATQQTETTEDKKDMTLQLLLNSIEKQFGKGSIISGDTDFPHVEKMSTGCLGLDLALGGGLGKGRIVEIWGSESSGKTTLALHTIAECQKNKGTCAFIDAEHALDLEYAEKLGVDVPALLLSQPDHGEQALNIVDTIVRSGAIDLVIVDSVAALVPRAELEGDVGDSHMGLQARMMSQALRKLSGITQKSNTTVIFINQIRMKIGVMFGNPETTTGGNALKFYASQRLEIKRIKTNKVGEEAVSNTSRIKIAKNKLAPPFKQIEVDIVFGRGIDRERDLLSLAEQHGIIDKSGAWYSYKENNIGQGVPKTCQYLADNPEVAEEIRQQVMEVVKK